MRTGIEAWWDWWRGGSRTDCIGRSSPSPASRAEPCAAPHARFRESTFVMRLTASPTRHPGLIDKFGGHAMAAGMSLAEQSLEQFREAFAAEIAQRADVDSLRGIIHSAGKLTGAE